MIVEKTLSHLDRALKVLIEQLNRMDKKLDKIIRQNEEIIDSQGKLLRGHKSHLPSMQDENFKVTPDALTLLSLPPSLRKTVMVLYKLGEATADDIAKETSRLRSVESDRANDLVRLGYVRKRRKGRKVYFYIEHL